MTHIICRATSCVFWEQGVCTSEEIEYEPDDGCLTYQDIGDMELEDEEEDFEWEDDEETDPFDPEDEDWDEERDETWEDSDDFDL
jgi:hypothetical protein